MGSGTLKIRRKLVTQALFVSVFFLCTLFAFSTPAHAAAGINQEINFQGRLLNAQGAVVPDGYYNMEFKIYQDGDGLTAGDTTGSPAGSLKWTSDYLNSNTQGVQVVNGYMSVQLGSVTPFGSSIDWNQDTLWLSMQVGDTSSCTISTTFQTDCGGDGEMVPMKRLSANAYALNSSLLGGLSSAQYVQLGQGLQTDASGNTSIYLNKTGAGNFVDLQSNGADAFTISGTGDQTFGANADHTLSVATAAASTAGSALTIASGAAGTGASALAGGDLAIAAGAGGGTNGNGGSLALNAGAPNGTGTAGDITIGTNYATNITIGNTSTSSQAKIQAGGASATVTNGGGLATKGSSSDTSTNALSASDSSGDYVVKARDDGQVTLGRSAGSSATFGKTSVGGTSDSGYASTLVAADKITTGAVPATLDSISNYSGAITGGENYYMGIYTDNSGAPDSLIATSSEGTMTANAWNTLAVSASLTANTSYWLAFFVNATSGTLPYQYYDAIGSNVHVYMSGATFASGLPSTFTVSGGPNVDQHSIYATVTESGSLATTLTVDPSSGVNVTTPTNTTTAFQVQNATGGEVFTVDSSSNSSQGQVVLGKVNANNGTLVFESYNSGSGGGYVSLAAPDITSANSYSLVLPAAAPTGSGQCLQTSSGSQLTFGACGTTGSFINNAYGTTQAGNFNIQGISASDATAVIEANNGGSGDILDMLDGSGNTVASFDKNGNLAVASQATVGQSNSTDGSVVFKNSANSNAVTLNSTAANSSYTLTLPTSSPNGGLCLETSPGNASQLIFASCSNNNASIQEVSEWDANNQNTVDVSPTTAGDEMVVATQIPTSGVTVSSISGGGVTNWTKIIANNGDSTVNRVEMWGGTVTSTGSSTITITYSASPGSNEVTATEYTAAGVNANTSWGIESSGNQLNSTASTTVTYPNLSAVNGSELYVGYAQVQNPPATAGSSTGFNYIITSTQHNPIAYNPSLTANTAYQPTANQNTSGESNTVAAILTAFVTSSSINNTTSLQKANFYVQAATSGTVAGVLQAASSGTADIFEVRNGSSANVLTVGSTGDLTLAPAASTTALQVKNTGGNGVFSVDTSNNQTVLGSSNNVAGVLAFADASDSNTISLSAPTSIATSYTLNLPTDTPTAGLCLGTSPTNANQLIFASCATQVSAAGISYVNEWDTTGSGVTSLTDSPSNKGNLLVFYSHTSGSATISSISGGGVGSWTKVTAYTGGGTPGNIEMWRGVVTTTGSGTISVTYSGTIGTNEIVAEEFTMGSSSGTWAIDTSGSDTTTSSVTTVNYPSLTAQNSSELYTGYAFGGGTMSTGSTSGFTYIATGASKYLAYDTNVTGGIAYAPTAPQTSGVYASIAAMVEAYSGTSVLVNTTATQEANFNIQAATAGTVAGILQAANSGTADIFQAQDSSGNNVAAINAASGLTLGTSNALGGELRFAASSNNNIISIVAPSTPGSSYSLTLPTTTPAPGECLASSPSNANQLVFSSCANQVTSIAISHVNNWSTSGNGVTSLSVSPANVGDLLVFFSSPHNGGASISTISGGGVGSWSKVTATNSGSGSNTSTIEMWRGVITTTGATTISVSFSTSTGNGNELAAMEFTTGNTTGSWVVDSSNTLYNSTSTTSMTYPDLTPQSSKDLYVGYGATQGVTSSTVSSGFTYVAGAQTNRAGLYDTAVSTETQPTDTLSTAGTSLTIGALVAAYSSSSVISNSTVTQQANFNVQAATSGTVAGVLQAYGGSSTSDVFDLMDGSGTIVDSFGYTGNLLVEPSTASAAALQVQTTGGVNVFSVDTSGKQVVIGAGSTGEASPSLLVLDSETGTSADPTEVDGAMYYNATNRTFRCGVDGSWQNCGGLLYANTSNSSAVNNCSNNCAAFNKSAPIPANYCQAGRVIKLSAAGYFSSQATASNLQFGVYYGTDSATASNDTLLGSLTPAATVTSASNNYFQMIFNITCFSTSTMQSSGTLTIQNGSSGAGMLTLPMFSISGTTVVTSSAKNIYIFPVWDTASTSNTITLSQFTASAD
jgi:trimeric autotransporter adhesin